MVFYIIFSVILAAFAVNNFNMVRAERKQLKRLEEMMEKRQHLDFISKLDKGSGISESEFILAVLEHIGTLDREKDIKPWVEVNIFLRHSFLFKIIYSFIFLF